MAKTRFDLVQFLACLADATRLRLLNLMEGREVCVCYFVEVLGEGQPKISRHLATLRAAGLVKARRDGKWMHYSMTPPENAEAAALLAGALRVGREGKLMREDLGRLGKACCAPEKFVRLEGAPVPVEVWK